MFETLKIDVTIPSLRASVLQHLQGHQEIIQEVVQKAVIDLANSSELNNLITNEANKAVQEVLSTSVRDYFRFGAGRAKVADAAHAMLDEMFSDVTKG